MGYRERMMASRDPRFHTLARKLYKTRDMVAEPPVASEDISEVRAEYKRVLGKNPFNGWDIETLKAKIAEHEASEVSDPE